MTENEAKKKLDNLHDKILRTSFCNKVYESEIEALHMAEDALEEIRKYRVCGTVKDIKELIEEWESYQALGTVEELTEARMQYDGINSCAERISLIGLCDFNEAKQRITSTLKSMSNNTLEEYKKLGTVEELREAMEKQMAKKQRSIDDPESHFRLSKAGFLCCSATNKDIRYPLISLRDLDYCPRCGQHIDWSEEE